MAGRRRLRAYARHVCVRGPRLTGWLRARLAAVPPWAVDLSIAVAAVAAGAYRIAVAANPSDTRPDALAFTLAGGMALGLLARRRQPLAMLVFVFVLWVAYHSGGYPGGAPAPALWAAIFTAGGRRLFMSPATARTHLSRAMVKLGARDRAQPVVLAYQSGLVAGA